MIDFLLDCFIIFGKVCVVGYILIAIILGWPYAVRGCRRVFTRIVRHCRYGR